MQHYPRLAHEHRLPRLFLASAVSVIFFLSAHHSHATKSEGAAFLKIPVGARAAGLGQAFTAMAEGVEALTWNSAGITRTAHNSPAAGLSLSHQRLFAENNLDHIGVVFPSRHPGSLAWGLSIARLSYDDLEGRDSQRRTTGNYAARDLAAGVALARSFGSVQFGTLLKWVRQDLAGEVAQGAAVDFGLMAPTPIQGLSVGGSLRNLGSPLRYAGEKYDLPLSASLGARYNVRGPLVLAADVQSRPRSSHLDLALGTEFLATRSFTLRAGYLSKIVRAVETTQRKEIQRGDMGLSGFSGGFGLRLEQFQLDYAFTPFGELGATQTFTLATWFGGENRKAPLLLATPAETVVVIEPEAQRGYVIIAVPTIEQEPMWGRLKP